MKHPPLWHDKDLYAPGRIVAAELIAVLHLASANRRVWPLVAGWGAEQSARSA